ncbi:acyl--CoA ligase [bacterium]|nr:acyl--CoA ligase [bacterium]
MIKAKITKLKECQNFSEVLYYQSTVNPERIFVHDVCSDINYSFKEFNSIVEKTSNYLLFRGVKQGDRVTAVIKNSPEYCFFYFATIRIGAIFNPMPFTSHKEEIKRNIRYVKPYMVLIDGRRFAEFEGEEGNFLEVPVDKEKTFEKRLMSISENLEYKIDINENKPACLYYSSGTTGDPKGILFSHKNMITNISSICRGFRFSKEQEVHLVFLPLGHTASTNYSFLPCMYIGGKMVLAESFWHIRNKIWQLIQEYSVTYMETVPTILYSILNIYKDTMEYNISSMRFVGCGSAPLQKNIQIEFEKRYNLKAGNLYGLSETGPTHIDYPLEENWSPGSIGFPLDINEVKIFDRHGNELGPNQMGEIVVKGPNVFIGYFENDSLYSKVVHNGYFHTGDTGYKDAEGRFYYVDRIKDLIIKGGTNIAPGEIDEVLLLHPAIKESVTIGIPDEMFGEEIKSFVVLKDVLSVSSDEILKHCRKYLPVLKLPKEIEIIESIPKTHSGKLLRKALRDKARLET